MLEIEANFLKKANVLFIDVSCHSSLEQQMRHCFDSKS